MTDLAFWNGIARKYAKSKISNVPAYEETLARVRTYLNEDDTVLEVGGGTGTTALKLADGVTRYTGTDIAPEMVTIANEKLADAPLDGLHFEVADERLKGFENGSFDAVLGFNIFHLVPDLDASFERINGVLKPDGLFISKTPCLKSKWFLRPIIWVMKAIGKAPSTVHFLGVDDYDARVRRGGFEIIETGLYPPSAPSRFVVARKK